MADPCMVLLLIPCARAQLITGRHEYEYSQPSSLLKVPSLNAPPVPLSTITLGLLDYSKIQNLKKLRIIKSALKLPSVER